jgi:hypothetical protein
VELHEVRYLEISARAREILSENESTREDSGSPRIEVLYRVEPTSFRLRTVMQAEGADLWIRIDAVADFTWDGDRIVPHELALKFIQDTGMVILHAYLRSAAAEMSQRLGAEPLVLPLYKSDRFFDWLASEPPDLQTQKAHRRSVPRQPASTRKSASSISS